MATEPVGLASQARDAVPRTLERALAAGRDGGFFVTSRHRRGPAVQAGGLWGVVERHRT